MIINLQGKILEGLVDGTEGATFTEQKRTEDGRLSKSFSQELTFYDDGFEIIRDELILDPDGKTKKIPIEIYDDCCREEDGSLLLLFQGIVRGDSIDWCEGDCFVKATLIEETDETVQMDCIKSTLIYDNVNGFQDQDHPRFQYCVEFRPSIYQDIIIVLGILLNVILLVLTPIVAIISVIIRIVAAIPGVNLNDELEDGILDDFNNWRNQLNENLIGCGRVHPSPLVRDYIENVCDICGVQFQSSILKNASSQYNNLAYMSAPVEKGTKDDSVKYISQNKPIKTLEGLLEDLRLVFNADYQLKEGILYFERRDFFDDGDTWLSYSDLKAKGQIIEEPCYEWRTEETPAAIKLEYSKDAVDWVGNEAFPYYSDVIGLNSPRSTLQRGIREVIVPFSPPRFRDDLIDRDVLGNYDSVFPINKAIKASEGALILNSGIFFQPKLVIWDGVDLNKAKVAKFSVSSLVNIFGDTSKFKDWPIDRVGHNWPMQFNDFQVDPNTAYDQDEPILGLYGRFYTIDHPKVLLDRGWNFTMTFKYKCADLRARSIYKTIELPGGTARIDKLEIDPDKQIITIYGKL